MRMASGRRKEGERERAHLIDIPTELLLYHQFPLFPDRVLSYIFQCWKVIGL